MIVADSIAAWLGEKRITHAFGIIGGGNVALWNSIASLGKTEIVSVHHEQAAAMAAAYYYRQCGRLALCLVTTGAGSSNAITGVLAAYFDSIPLLVISGNEPSRFLAEPQRVKGYQGYCSSRFANPICKEAHYIKVWPGLRDEILRRELSVILDTATGGRQGPVWIDCAKDVQTREIPR